MVQAGIVEADYTDTCAKYDFADLTSLRVFVNGILNDEDPATEAATVGLTEANMVLFNTLNGASATGTFADVL